jgi:hypothetical protein
MTEADQLKTIREYSVTGLLLRLPLGLLFFFAGLNKFLGLWQLCAVDRLRHGREDLAARRDALPYGYACPSGTGIGSLLILGLSRARADSHGFLLLSLMFGKILAQDHATVANIANYCLIAAVGYYFNRHHLFSLDALLRKAHFSEEI